MSLAWESFTLRKSRFRFVSLMLRETMEMEIQYESYSCSESPGDRVAFTVFRVWGMGCGKDNGNGWVGTFVLMF